MIILLERQEKRCTLNDLVFDNWQEDRTAFFGLVGASEPAYFLVTFSQIVQLDNPSNTYANKSAPVTIYKWVDLSITIVEQT